VRLRVGFFLSVVAPVVALAMLAAYSLSGSHRQFHLRAEALTQNLAAALERSVSADIEKIDVSLISVADHLEAQLARGPLDVRVAKAYLEMQTQRRPELRSIRITDAQGQLMVGPDPLPSEPINLADRDWFQRQRESSTSDLHTSRPLRSKLTGEWIVSLSRRYRDAGGRFAGAISAALPLNYFQSQLQAIDVGQRGAVALRDEDLGLIAQWPVPRGAAAQAVGAPIDAPEVRLMRLAGLLHGTLDLRTGADPVERITSFRRLAFVPMVVVVGVSSRDFLADWRREVQLVVAAAAASVALYVAGLAFLARTLAQKRKAQERIELLANVFEHTGEALIMSDSDNHIIEVNPAFERFTGFSAQEVIGRSPLFLLAPRNAPATIKAMLKAVREQGHWRGEVWDRLKDGREIPAWLSVSAVRDENGAILRIIASSIDMSEQKRAEEKILHLAHHDVLTQLPNRVLLMGRLEQAMARARRECTELALLFIDLDRFKNVNDTFGHHVGDGLLLEVGQRLCKLVRDSDIVARLGGDEFVIVLADTGSSALRTSAAVATDIIRELSGAYMVEGHELHSTPSIGIGVFPQDGSDPDTLLKNADLAMYHAKSAGRNNFQFFTAAMNEATAERLALEGGLRTAIERNELSVHYQPQVDLATGRTLAFEALLRWRHPQLGQVPPLKFIPVAEDSGQIEAIGAWVLDQALAQVARWQAAGHTPLRVAVNLSAQQLRTEGFVTLVSLGLERHGLQGAALELEITESMAMRDPARTADMLRQLRGLGVSLAIDDFGTGHSSLSYLKQLPLNYLKLDRSFVMDLEHDANDAAICKATIQMAHSLGLGVVAEGVENAAQLAYLRQLGCDVVQGYFFSKPMPVADCDVYLQAQSASKGATVGPEVLPT
jgi:diguanylate cyclase (GGDEF)-like protein/PAS domain S-box-containing protein